MYVKMDQLSDIDFALSDKDDGFKVPKRQAKAKKTTDKLTNIPIGLSNSFSVLELDNQLKMTTMTQTSNEKSHLSS